MGAQGRAWQRPAVGPGPRRLRRGLRWFAVVTLAVTPFLLASPAAARSLPDRTQADDAESYVSPTWGYELTFDPDDWEVVEESSEGGFDRLELFNGPSFVSVWGLPGYGGDPTACRDDWVRLIRRGEGIQDFAPLEDDAGEPIAGESAERAFAAYAYTSEDGEEVLALDCRTLVPGVGNLLVILETLADEYEEQSEALADLLEGLDLSGVEEPDPDELQDEPPDLDVGTARRPADEDVDQIVIVDSFNNPSRSRLSTVSPDPAQVRYAYEDGEFVIETLDPEAGIWQAGVDGVYADVSLAIDARFAGDVEGRVVLIGCRYGAGEAGPYEYTMLANPAAATVSLVRWDEGEPTYLVENAAAPFGPATEPNRLELSCVGEAIRASVNGQVAAEVEDDAYESGFLYVAAGTLDVPGTSEARFDNLLITVFGD